MKKRLLAFIFTTVIASVLNAYPAAAQSSQAIRAEVPFAFTTNGKTLPAGTYRIESVTDSRTVWRIRSNEASIFLLARILSGSGQGDLKMTFHKYGDRRFLSGFITASYQVELPASKAEKVLRAADQPMETIEVAMTETMAGGSR